MASSPSLESAESEAVKMAVAERCGTAQTRPERNRLISSRSTKRISARTIFGRRLIEEESDRQPVSRLYRTLGVTRSGYYDWQRQPLSDRAVAAWLLTEQIRGIFEESEQTYSTPGNAASNFMWSTARGRHRRGR